MSRAVADSRVGMASMKEYSVTKRRFFLSMRPATITAAARDTPGMKARHWAMPMRKA